VQPPVPDGVGDGLRDGLADGLGDALREGLADGLGDALREGLADGLGLGEAVVRDGVGDGLVVGGAPLALVMTTMDSAGTDTDDPENALCAIVGFAAL
jgi:hypothetical protein